MLNDLILRLRALFKRTTVEHEIDDELRFHLERQIESYEKAGIDHSDALRRARLQFGGLDQAKEEYRDALGVRLVDDVRRDLRHTIRSLRATPAFSLTVIATLALGIGANAAVFSMINSVLLLPLRFSEPARLFLVRAHSEKDGVPTSYSYLDFLDARRGSRSFEGMAAWRGHSANLSGIGEPEYVQARQASAGFFSLLGVNLALGREFSAEEDRPGAEPVALISYETWQRRFSGEPRVLGARVTLDGKPHVVVGVLPPGFDFFGNVPVYTPLGQYADISMRGRQFRPGIWAVGRLKTGVTVAEARAELGVLGRQLAEEYPATNRYWTFTIVPLRDGIVGDADRTLFLLAGAVGLLLLIACANVANLFLARSAARSHEFAIRVAIGASRYQIARQILTESVAVSLVGGVVGLFAGSLAARLIRGGLLTQMPQLTTLSLDTRVLVFTVGASALAGIVFGLVVVLQQEHNALSVVTQGSRSITRGFRRTQAGLVVTQVALAFVLLAGSGLMLRTISGLLSVDMGFDPKNVLTTGVGLSPAVTSDPARIRTAWKEILARVSAIPGVESAAINISLPLQGEESVQYSVGPGGASGDPLPSARVGAPTLDYWKAMRIPLVRGRLFTEQDIASSPLVLIIDELLAANAFPGEDPIGKQLNLQHVGSARVVGVVRHLRYSAVDEDVSGASKAQVYVPFEQLPDAFLRPLAPGMRLVLRTSVNPASIQQSLRQAVAGPGLDQPVHHVATMEQIIGGSLAERWLVLQMLGIFGGLALALTSVGIAGVVSYTMSRRLREIAIRIALGARPQQVLGFAVGQGMTMVALGVGVGLAAWFALMQIISRWLYKVTPTDPVTLAGVAAILSAVTLAATYLPAHRSLRVDPVHVLRYQ